MIYRRKVMLLAMIFAIVSSSHGELRPSGSSADLAKPTPAQAAWHDMEVGMFYHFDMRTMSGVEKPINPAPLKIFNPTKLDTDQWLEAAKAIGAKYAILVVKHSSGFMLWQSDLYPYSVKQTPWRDGKGDILADFIRSCKKYDIKPGIYASMTCNSYWNVLAHKVNRGKGGDPEALKKYSDMCEKMVTELWTKYGKFTEIWFDGGVLPVEKGGPDLVPILKKHQPQAVVFQSPERGGIRWVGNEKGVADYPCWSTVKILNDPGSGDPDGKIWNPGECDVPVRNHHWFWNPNQDHKLYSLNELVDMYYKSVGRNCTLLLNANPNRDGLIPEADMKRYIEFGKEIRRRFSRPIARTTGKGKKVELSLKNPSEINHVIIMEDIAQGERVRVYKVEGLLPDGQWIELCEGQSIGHKRIQVFDTKTLKKIRLRVTKSAVEPIIRELAVYNVK